MGIIGTQGTVAFITQTIIKPKEILKEEKRFYESVYESKNPKVEDSKRCRFRQGDLSPAECLNALKGFLSSKTPSTDLTLNSINSSGKI